MQETNQVQPGKGQLGEPISTSLFYMWRVIVAIAHADGVVSDGERGYLEKIFSNLDRVYGLTAEQKETFAADLETPQDIASLMPHINDPAVRGQLIYFGGLMVHADGHANPTEEAILQKLRADQMASLDMDKIHADVKKHVADEMFAHDMKMQSLRPQRGLSGALDGLLLRLGIDILD